MSDLSRRPGNRLGRRQRVDRAYQLTVAGGTASAVFVVTAVLAVVGILGWGLPVISLIVAIVCFMLFRRTVSR
jgi:hypothetical protein